MTHSLRVACVGVALVASGAAPQAALYAQDFAPLTFLRLSRCRHEHTDAKTYKRNEPAVVAHHLNGNSFTIWHVPQAPV